MPAPSCAPECPGPTRSLSSCSPSSTTRCARTSTTDPGHGRRGAELARRLLAGVLDAAREELLFRACRDHTDGYQTEQPTLGVCWDADRLNLRRVGIRPDPGYLSTAAARKPELIARAETFHDSEYEWDDLADSLSVS